MEKRNRGSKYETLKEVCSTIRLCNLCGVELLEHTIHKASALWKRWYVCKQCYKVKVKKRYDKKKDENPLWHKAMSIRRRFTFSDVTQEWMENAIITNLGKPCFYCKDILTLDKVSPDHKQPVSRGGSNMTDNIRIICRKCNFKKSALTETEFMLLIEILTPYPELKQVVMSKMGSAGFVFNKKGG